MKRMRNAALMGIIGLLLAGCVEAKYYYQPQAPSGSVQKWWKCSQDPADIIVFTDPALDWVHMSARAGYDGYGATAANIILTIYKTTPQFTKTQSEEEIKRIEEMRNRHVAVAVDSTRIVVTPDRGPPQEFKLELPYGGKMEFVLSYEDWSQGYRIVGSAPRSFDVDLPAISFDGTKLVLPRVHFTRTVGTYYQGPTACSLSE